MKKSGDSGSKLHVRVKLEHRDNISTQNIFEIERKSSCNLSTNKSREGFK